MTTIYRPLAEYRALLTVYLRPERTKVLLVALLLLLSSGLQLLNPQILRYFIDSAQAGSALRSLILIALLFIGAALGNQILSVAITYLSERVAWSATNALREDLMEHCLRLDMSFHTAHTPGELIERVDGDVAALSNFFSQFVILVLGSLLLLLGVLVLLYREDWRVGLALTFFSLIAIMVLNRSRSIGVPYVQQERQASAEFFGFLEERLAAAEDIRANGAQPYIMRQLYHFLRELFHKGRRAMMMGALLWAITTGLFTIGYVLAFGLGAALFRSGVITIGTVYLIFHYTELLRQPLEQLTTQFREFQRANASILRIRELYALQPRIQEHGDAPLPDSALTVAFEDVSFAYNAEQMTLKQITFTLDAGRVLGVLGRTGSGKTTLSRLLFRLYGPQQGTIRLSGVDIRDVQLAHLQRHVGLVTQDVQLFHASVRDNLTLFDPAISDQRIMQALEDLGLLPWFATLPAGLDTELAGDSSGLSAGQAQLLALTRIFLRDPGLVILDEPSSRLDRATESLIEAAISKLLTNRTGIVIAHRLGTVQRADDILIMEHGQICEWGDRETLAKNPGSRFARLLQTGLKDVLT